jgi:hypothetical protein
LHRRAGIFYPVVASLDKTCCFENIPSVSRSPQY